MRSHDADATREDTLQAYWEGHHQASFVYDDESGEWTFLTALRLGTSFMSAVVVKEDQVMLKNKQL